MQNTTYPCLWFNGQAKAAADFYCSIFPDSKILNASPQVVNWELNGQKFMGLNGGPMFNLNASISMFANFDSIETLNDTWNQLIDGGSALMPIDKYPWSERYSWLKDMFGVSWQIIPTSIGKLMSNPETGNQVMQELLKMHKIDISILEKAAQI